MATGTRGLVGKEDISFHDPLTTGGVVQTFNRTTSTGGTTPITKLSADHVPLRDVAVVAGARTPFYGLDAGVGTNHYVEDALADIRKNIPHYRNVEHYGMVPGDSTNAVAEKNTAVWNKIIADIAASGNPDGIFFPGGQWYFKDTAGSEVLSGGDQANIKVVGTGPGSALLANAGATAAFPLLRWLDCAGVTLLDLQFARQAATADCVVLAASTIQLANLRIASCTFSSGDRNLLIDGGGTTSDKDIWLQECTFTTAGAASYNLAITGCSYTHVNDNTFAGTGVGMHHFVTAGTEAMRDIRITGNIFQTAGMNCNVTRTSTYSATNHRGVTIADNRLAGGDIAIVGMNRVLLQLNKLYAGKVSISCATMTTAQGLQLIGNEIVGGTGPGINITGSSTTIEGFEILGGSIANCTQQGIMVSTAGAPAKWGRIQGVAILNCSREDSGVTDYSGIKFNAADASGGVTESLVVDNVIRCTSVTAINSNKHLYGVEEAAGGVSDKNMIGPNFIQGYVTADVLVSGAASLDVVAAVTASVATYARHDGGAGV